MASFSRRQTPTRAGSIENASRYMASVGRVHVNRRPPTEVASNSKVVNCQWGVSLTSAHCPICSQNGIGTLDNST
jgi:hypothetical protein